MKQVYIMCSHSGTNISKFLRFFTRKKYTHISISLGDDLHTFYSFARRKLNNPFIGGLVVEHPNEGVYGKYKDAICAIYKIKVTEEQYEKIKNLLVNMLADYDRYTYSYISVPLLFFRIPLRRRYKFTCSQFVAYLLEKNGVNIGTRYELCRPEDFHLRNKVFEGFLTTLTTEVCEVL